MKRFQPINVFTNHHFSKIQYQPGNIIPLTHFFKIARGIVLKGLGFTDLIPQIAALVIIASVILILCIRKFQKRII